MSALRKDEIEDIRRIHHPAPWLPSANEADAYGSDQVRLAAPDPGENLLHRYREVLSGISPRFLDGKPWDDNVYLASNRFEWALADLLACTHCNCESWESKEAKDWRGPDDKPVVLRNWHGCRTVAGGGWYMDLHRKKTAEAGYPIFVMTNCKSPSDRLITISNRVVKYR